jgi:hypothetical protein
VKYIAKIKEAQFAGGVKLLPEGGTVTDAEARVILKDSWGKKLVDTGRLKFDGEVKMPGPKPQRGMSVGSATPATSAAPVPAKAGKKTSVTVPDTETK